MAAFYLRRIKSGKATLSTVPVRWKEEVLELLNKELEDGEITQEEYNIYIQ